VFIALTLGFLVERKKKEQAARIEAERLAAIGKVVSEIAHDMKSPLDGHWRICKPGVQKFV